MMKKYLLYWLLLFNFASIAQINTQWINNFCCFDSIAPHSFSYPYGIVVKNDSAVIACYEDDSLKIKILDLVSGTDISDFNYETDFVLPAFNYKGDFVKCNDGYLNSIVIYKNFEWRLMINKFNSGFVIDSLGSFVLGSENATKILSVGDTSFYIVYQKDSIRLININTNSNSIRQYSFDNDVHDILPEMFLNSSNELILAGRHLLGGTNYVVILKKFDLQSGTLIQTQIINSTVGNSHKCFVSNDSLYIASTSNTVGDVTFAAVEMNTLLSSIEEFVGVTDLYYVGNFAPNNNADKYYIETYEYLIQINPDHSVGFVRNLTGSSFNAYNQSKILFDANDNPILFRSYINNTIVNDDLLLLRIDKNSGLTIDSLVYNDIRNTPDIAISQFFDNNGQLNLLFANDYDDNVILQEETQLNLLHMNTLTNNHNEILKSVKEIYPNPTPGNLFFNLTGIRSEEIQVLDYTGRIMKVYNSNLFIDISDLVDGIYFLKIMEGEESRLLFKVIKTGN